MIISSIRELGKIVAEDNIFVAVDLGNARMAVFMKVENSTCLIIPILTVNEKDTELKKFLVRNGLIMDREIGLSA